MSTTDKNQFRETLVEAIAPWSLNLTDPQLDQLVTHYEIMVETNRTLNLTRITDPIEAAVKLYADSLALLGWLAGIDAKITRIVDIGTGAGFPAFPLAVARPNWTVYALDARNKKARFLAEAAQQCGVTNLDAIHARAEKWNAPAEIDVVTFKAVAPLTTCLGWSRSLVRPGGFAVAYKTSIMALAEQRQADSWADRSKWSAEPSFDYQLPHPSGRLDLVLRIYSKPKHAPGG